MLGAGQLSDSAHGAVAQIREFVGADRFASKQGVPLPKQQNGTGRGAMGDGDAVRKSGKGKGPEPGHSGPSRRGLFGLPVGDFNRW
jgi:hypothetical protein